MSLFSFLNNPITLAAAAVIAIGVIAYEILNHQREGNVHYGRGGRGPRRSDDDSRRGSRGPERPVDDSRRSGSGPGRPDDDFRNGGKGPEKPDNGLKRPANPSSSVAHDNPENQLRRRKREETDNNHTQAKFKNCGEYKKSSDGSKDINQNSEFDTKQYCQNVFDKIENDVKNINKKDDTKKDFEKNIKDVEAASPENNNLQTLNEAKLINTSISDHNMAPADKNIQSSSSARSNEENQEASEESAARGDNAARANDQKNDTASNNAPCRACEESLAKAVAFPCGHCYLCADCAIIIHRIYKKCTICDSVVYYFERI